MFSVNLALIASIEVMRLGFGKHSTPKPLPTGLVSLTTLRDEPRKAVAKD